MPPLRIYIETSVWSFAFAEDSPDYRGHTLEFFDRCRGGAFETFIPPVVLAEIRKAGEPLRTLLAGLIREIRPMVVEVSPEARGLADVFLRKAVVPAAKPEDAQHVAVAFAQRLDVLVSWNFKHIANVRRVDRFNAIALLEGYHQPLRIVSPSEVLYDDQSAQD